MPTIRIDDEVWAWLKRHAQPFEDTPNSVLRRLAGLETGRPSSSSQRAHPPTDKASSGRSRRGLTGRQLNIEWKVGALHALYHQDGNYFNHLRYFPGALFDPRGYVVFKSEQEYKKSPHLQHGAQLHVPNGISSIPSYVRVR